MKQATYTTIDQYIAGFPPETQTILQKVRQTIQQAAPEATEKISYGIPTFVLHGNLVHFGAYPTHIGFYPGSAPIAAFADQLEPYETAKGTVRFPLNQPIPYELIKQMTTYAVERNLANKKK